MRRHLRVQRWVLSFLLALPAILLPSQSSWSIRTTHYDVGWPLVAMDAQIYLENGRWLHFQNFLPNLPLLCVLWTVVAWVLWSVRLWALRCEAWRGSLIQVFLVTGYSVLLFFCGYGLVGLVWELCLQPMDFRSLISACQFGYRWLPTLYALGVVAVCTLIISDAFTRPMPQQFLHGIGVVLVMAGVWCLLLPILASQMHNLKGTIDRSQQRIQTAK